ncbi:hypothetical protein Glove_16g97 [Diversispora epigaea]|uniref:Uncharacterized protein n=1 Tax=Diversispora epigaea TaxID=1348612 RepID=A0A397JNX2_9GLOM|nr:hypothetical protein Glove_16g97 [Diversispora epigaea]
MEYRIQRKRCPVAKTFEASTVYCGHSGSMVVPNTSCLTLSSFFVETESETCWIYSAYEFESSSSDSEMYLNLLPMYLMYFVQFPQKRNRIWIRQLNQAHSSALTKEVDDKKIGSTFSISKDK